MHSTALTGEPLRTFQGLGAGSSPRNATWSDIRALLDALAAVTVEDAGKLTATRNGHVLTLHPALTKDIGESGEVNVLRRFLQDSEAAPIRPANRDPHLLVVIQGPEARLYRCQVLGGIPQLILPYVVSVPNPEDRTAARSRPGATPPKSDGFFMTMADELQAAGQILVFGPGSEAALFVQRLSQHDSELSARIIGTVQLGEVPLDLAGLLVAARKFYATLVPPDGHAAALGEEAT